MSELHPKRILLAEDDEDGDVYEYVDEDDDQDGEEYVDGDEDDDIEGLMLGKTAAELAEEGYTPEEIEITILARKKQPKKLQVKRRAVDPSPKKKRRRSRANDKGKAIKLPEVLPQRNQQLI